MATSDQWQNEYWPTESYNQNNDISARSGSYNTIVDCSKYCSSANTSSYEHCDTAAPVNSNIAIENTESYSGSHNNYNCSYPPPDLSVPPPNLPNYNCNHPSPDACLPLLPTLAQHNCNYRPPVRAVHPPEIANFYSGYPRLDVSVHPPDLSVPPPDLRVIPPQVNSSFNRNAPQDSNYSTSDASAHLYNTPPPLLHKNHGSSLQNNWSAPAAASKYSDNCYLNSYESDQVPNPANAPPNFNIPLYGKFANVKHQYSPTTGHIQQERQKNSAPSSSLPDRHSNNAVSSKSLSARSLEELYWLRNDKCDVPRARPKYSSFNRRSPVQKSKLSSTSRYRDSRSPGSNRSSRLRSHDSKKSDMAGEKTSKHIRSRSGSPFAAVNLKSDSHHGYSDTTYKGIYRSDRGKSDTRKIGKGSEDATVITLDREKGKYRLDSRERKSSKDSSGGSMKLVSGDAKKLDRKTLPKSKSSSDYSKKTERASLAGNKFDYDHSKRNIESATSVGHKLDSNHSKSNAGKEIAVRCKLESDHSKIRVGDEGSVYCTLDSADYSCKKDRREGSVDSKSECNYPDKKLEDGLGSIEKDEINEVKASWIRSSPSDLYYKRDERNPSIMRATNKLMILCEKFEEKLLRRGQVARELRLKERTEKVLAEKDVNRMKSNAELNVENKLKENCDIENMEKLNSEREISSQASCCKVLDESKNSCSGTGNLGSDIGSICTDTSAISGAKETLPNCGQKKTLRNNEEKLPERSGSRESKYSSDRIRSSKCSSRSSSSSCKQTEKKGKQVKNKKFKKGCLSDCSSSDSEDFETDGSSSSSGSDDEEWVTKGVEEMERKKRHPDRLHEELWFNDPDEMNDGPLCRCSMKARRSGIRHGYYVGEEPLNGCDRWANNSNRLHHYLVTISPPTNFLVKSPTIITHDSHEFLFEGFSLLSHHPLEEVPTCQIIRFNIEYAVFNVEEKMPENFCIKELDLFYEFLFKEILELVDLNLKAIGDSTGCPRFHFLPRFVRKLPDNGKEVLSMNEVLMYLLRNSGPLVKEEELSKLINYSEKEWLDYTDQIKGMIATYPGKKPCSIRVDQLDRDQLSEDTINYPVIVHFGIRPPQLSYAGNPLYQKALREYVKFRHLLANMPKPSFGDKRQLEDKENYLQEMRMASNMKREVTVDVSAEGFFKTGIMCDIVQHALLLPVLVRHLRFHRSLVKLEENIGYKFINRFLLQLALTHPSYRENFGTNPDHARNSLSNCGVRQPRYGDKKIQYMNTHKRGINTLVNIMSRFGRKEESESKITHNERLEFLGDAVVEFLSSIHLFHLFPSLEEGGLATYRAAVVQNQHLSVLAEKLDLDKFVLHAHGSDLCHTFEVRHAMANCFEALMGAIFIDSGIEEADAVFSATLFKGEHELLQVWINYKPHPLQEQEPDGDRRWIETFPLLQKMATFEESIGAKFSHIRLLARAFTDRSIGFNYLTLGSNQRLEFLGDTVLQLIASEYLYKYFPEHHEGHLSLLRSSLVNNRTQAVVCDDLNMTEYAIYSSLKPELKTKDRADLLEAFLGSLYIDQGLDYCRTFCNVCFFPRLQHFIINQEWNDPKSKLQQCCLTLRSMEGGEPDIPVYKVIECKGPTNTRVYTVAVYFRDKRLSKASGHSIQRAEMLAAKKALLNNKGLFPQLAYQRRVIRKNIKIQGVDPRRFSSSSNLVRGARQHGEFTMRDRHIDINLRGEYRKRNIGRMCGGTDGTLGSKSHGTRVIGGGSKSGNLSTSRRSDVSSARRVVEPYGRNSRSRSDDKKRSRSTDRGRSPKSRKKEIVSRYKSSREYSKNLSGRESSFCESRSQFYSPANIGKTGNNTSDGPRKALRGESYSYPDKRFSVRTSDKGPTERQNCDRTFDMPSSGYSSNQQPRQCDGYQSPRSKLLSKQC